MPILMSLFGFLSPRRYYHLWRPEVEKLYEAESGKQIPQEMNLEEDRRRREERLSDQLERIFGVR